jgi:hypothetical protein
VPRRQTTVLRGVWASGRRVVGQAGVLEGEVDRTGRPQRCPRLATVDADALMAWEDS